MRRLFHAVAASLLAATATLAIGSPAFADKVRDDQWHLTFLNVAQAHQISQGEGITVAVLDTGVDNDHPDLVNNVLPGTDTVQGGNGNGWGDVDGHGSGMAGLIAGHGHGANGADGALGIAPKAKILPIRIGTDLGIGTGAAMGQAVDEAVRRGAKIINISIGTSNASFEAVMRALDAGVIVIASSGNRPREEFIGDPGSYPGVVAVGAVDRAGNVADVSVRGKALSLTAPGVDIVSSGKDGGYRIGTGTSPSGAIVSGAAALVWSKYPQLTSTQVVEHLTRTATDKGASGRDEEYGFGVIDIVKALNTTPVTTSPSTEGTPDTTAGPSTPDDDGLPIGPLVGIGVGVLVILIVVVAAARRRRG